ncbi:MAG TPA: thioredoxin domain-containing protein, partial [Alphaproteobacteria bacterium]|nr:thioredoxin domain-containing protein [Alphaproteobacteria bacterium]
AGLTDAQIDACLNDQGLENAILGERLQAEQTAKIEATPTFIFNKNNDDKIVSAAPFDDFKKKIDGLMK